MSVVKEMLRYNIASFWCIDLGGSPYTVSVGYACAMQVIATERMAHCLMAGKFGRANQLYDYGTPNATKIRRGCNRNESCSKE